jgi:hypothetical protein
MVDAMRAYGDRETDGGGNPINLIWRRSSWRR